MKMTKMVSLAATMAALPFISVFANPVDVSITATTPPQHYWGLGYDVYFTDFQDEDVIQQSPGAVSPVNLGGANSLQVTWNAPAGYMYVVNPPPADFQNNSLTLAFCMQYGHAGQASSLGSVTAFSVSMNLVYGNPGLSGGAFINNLPNESAITLDAGVNVTPQTTAFAFTSVTVDATFSGTGAYGTILDPNYLDDAPSAFFGILYGIPTIYGAPYDGPPNPGQLLTLEQVPDPVPDMSSTLGLTVLSGLGLLLTVVITARDQR